MPLRDVRLVVDEYTRLEQDTSPQGTLALSAFLKRRERIVQETNQVRHNALVLLLYIDIFSILLGDCGEV